MVENLPETVVHALTEAHDLAMDRTVRARIPECGDFGAIAQNLAYVLQELGLAKSNDK